MPITQKTTKAGYTQFWADGKRLPSVTTICNRYKESGGLMHWANAEGLEGRTLQDAKSAAVTPGSIVHKMIECQIRGHEFDREFWEARIVSDHLDPDQIWSAVNQSWSAFKDWSETNKLNVIAAELSLGSEKYLYGGTLDAVGLARRVALLDWKTGSLYPDHLIQVGGGYVQLWEENMSEKLQSIDLLSISKTHGGFMHASFPRASIQVCVDQFLALRECYERDKKLKKMI